MRWWEKQIGGAARGRIIALLRRGTSTVEELAAELGVTDNAVRAHLQLLEREGLLRASGTRQGPGAGKPATTYELSEGSESALSSAYAPVLTALLQILAERMPAEHARRHPPAGRAPHRAVLPRGWIGGRARTCRREAPVGTRFRAGRGAHDQRIRAVRLRVSARQRGAQ